MAVNYKLVESEGEGYHSDHWAIQILEGECEGLTYQYDTVQFNEVDGQGVLDFQTISIENPKDCLLYTSPSPRDRQKSRMPSSA